MEEKPIHQDYELSALRRHPHEPHPQRCTELNKVNPFECLVALNRHNVLVEETPPWNGCSGTTQTLWLDLGSQDNWDVKLS